MDPACALWFPDERTIVEFEPRFPFWSEEFDDYSPDAADRAFGAGRSTDPEPPDPLEYHWIPWIDLDTPDLIVDHLRATFARATRRTGIHTLDPHRHRRQPRQPG